MTICVAAIATDTDGKECIVFATDRMVSVPIGHFEHDMRKYQKIDDHTVAMLAGRALLFDDLILLPRPDMGYDEIVHEIFSNFKR